MIRTILKIPIRSSSRDGFKELGLMTVTNVYLYKLLLLAKQYYDLKTFTANKDVHEYSTRSAKNIHISLCRTEKFKGSPLNMAIKYLNMLPYKTRELEAAKFKKTIKNYLTKNVFYTKREIDLKHCS